MAESGDLRLVDFAFEGVFELDLATRKVSWYDAEGRAVRALGALIDITSIHEKLEKQARFFSEAEALGHTGSWEHAFGTNVDATDQRRIEAQLRRRVDQQAALADLGLRALRGVDLQELFEETVTVVARHCDTDLVVVAEPSKDDRSLVLLAVEPKSEGQPGEVIHPLSPNAMGMYVMKSNEPVIVRDLKTDPRFHCCPFLLRAKSPAE